MLSYQLELSGYDIRRWIGWGLRYYFGIPAHSQIYTELKKLEQLGLVTSRIASGGGTRSRRLYKITDEGLDAVYSWAIDAPVDPPVLKHGLLMRVMFGHLSNADKLRNALQEHIAYADDMQAAAANDARLATGEPAWAYARLALRWADRYYANERELARQMLKELDDTQSEFESATDGTKTLWPTPEYWYELEKKADAEEPS